MPHLKELVLKASSNQALGAQLAHIDKNSTQLDAVDSETGTGSLVRTYTSDSTLTERPSLHDQAKIIGREELQKRFNHAMLRLVCAAGLAPSVVDYDEWKEMIGIANPRIKTISSTTLSDILIPHEASFVQQETIKELKLSSNLTISYDGGTTRLKESIYTFHATTSDPREAYLLEGNEASGESHTAKHIAAILERVRCMFSLICFISIEFGLSSSSSQ